MNQHPAQQQIQLQYVDRPDVSETYVDLLEKVFVNGPLVRLEFCVNRMNEPKPPKPPTGKKITASRLVMPLPALLQMADQINKVVKALEQQGVIKRTPITMPPTGLPN